MKRLLSIYYLEASILTSAIGAVTFAGYAVHINL